MNVINKVERRTPPKPTARKDNPVNAEFEDRAKEFLRDAMRRQGVTVEQLTERLARIGVEISKGGVANKISRGGFSAAFFFQCMEALDADVHVRPK